MSAGPAVIQRSSQAALIAWSQAQAATAAYEVIGTKSDFAILRLRGQQVGGAQVTLEFHIHVPNGEVERAYAGALYEADNRDDGELKSHDEASVNRIVSRWKDAMAALGTTTFETQEVKAANARRAEEAEAAETLRAEQAEGARLAEAVPVADESTEEFVRRLLTGQAEGLITFEIRTLDKAAAEDLPAKKALLQEYWLGHNARKQQEAEGATGKW